MPIVLIGPPGAGKSTIGLQLAAALGREFVDADAVCGPLYAEVGWSVDRFRRLTTSRVTNGRISRGKWRWRTGWSGWSSSTRTRTR